MKNLEETLTDLQKQLDEIKKQIKEQEFKYPIYLKSKNSSLVVKFTDLTTGEVVVNSIIYKVGDNPNWIRHTDIDTWQQLEICPETGFFDGQAVWCWDNDYTHIRSVRFYDARNKRTFTHKGEKQGSVYENYEPYEGDYLPWMIEAFKKINQ